MPRSRVADSAGNVRQVLSEGNSHSMLSSRARMAVWIFLYLACILAPLFALFAGSFPPARDFWTEFSIALGYSGLAIMGLQFSMTARFRFVNAPWGEDVIYYFHRKVSLIAVALVIAHPLILFAVRPELLALLNFINAPWRARFAALSVYSLITMVVMALWRKNLNIRYETWHATHLLLAVVAVTAGIAHMVGWGLYLVSPWKRGLWIAMAISWIGVLFYIRIVKPLYLFRRPYRVASVREERGDTVTLVMKPDGHAGFHFTPGQFAWLTVGRTPFRITGHPFSFSSSAAKAGEVEMTIRNLGDFTSTLRRVRVGERAYLEGPYGSFTVGHPADMHVLIAGGIGITPMMSMIRTFADSGDKRPITLLYGNPDWESVTFREELEALKARLDMTIVHVLVNPPAGWTGEQGFITAEILKRYLTPPYAAHEYFICGPDVMMDSIEGTLGELNIPISKYHSERYNFV